MTVKIIFLGPPGVGKGTCASRISEKLGIPHISAGDMLRAEVAAETEIGKKVKDILDKGNLVPDELVLDVVKKRISKQDCENGFVLDGFPRTIGQAEGLEKITNIDIVINLTQPEDVLIERILARRTCKNCGNSYNIADIRRDGINMPPLLPKVEGICDKCGGELVKRSDETPEIIANRMKVYREQTEPLIEFYKNKNILVDVFVDSVPSEMVEKIYNMLKEKSLVG